MRGQGGVRPVTRVGASVAATAIWARPAGKDGTEPLRNARSKRVTGEPARRPLRFSDALGSLTVERVEVAMTFGDRSCGPRGRLG